MYALSNQDCKLGTVLLPPGLQAPPHAPLDSDPHGLTPEQSHFHRAQSVTSAVDYEYFDMGIGQVAQMHRHTIRLLVLGSNNS